MGLVDKQVDAFFSFCTRMISGATSEPSLFVVCSFASSREKRRTELSRCSLIFAVIDGIYFS